MRHKLCSRELVPRELILYQTLHCCCQPAGKESRRIWSHAYIQQHTLIHWHDMAFSLTHVHKDTTLTQMPLVLIRIQSVGYSNHSIHMEPTPLSPFHRFPSQGDKKTMIPFPLPHVVRLVSWKTEEKKEKQNPSFLLCQCGTNHVHVETPSVKLRKEQSPFLAIIYRVLLTLLRKLSNNTRARTPRVTGLLVESRDFSHATASPCTHPSIINQTTTFASLSTAKPAVPSRRRDL